MTENKSSYRKIMQATSIFGGVQILNILISIARSKTVAMLLGPAGMGIAGLFASSTHLVILLTSFGVNSVAVKNIAEANASNDTDKIARTITLVKKLVWLTGLLGFVVTVILSPILSEMIFDNNKYILSFIFLSITIILGQLSQGQLVLLQGLQKIKELAKANLIGVFFSFLFSIPLYYFYKTNGIVPAMIVSSVIGFLVTWYYSAKIKIKPVNLTFKETFAEGKSILIMGVTVSLTLFMSEGLAYLLRIFITKTGGLDQVGYYGAGFTIINSYIGMVFTAMGTDFFPRLSAVSKDNKMCSKLINQQAELALILLAPIVTVFIVFIKLIVVILYSKEFIPMIEMVQWAIMGVFFKSVSWAIAFVFLAKGDNKLFFWNELIASIYMLILNVIGYHYMKLTGLGISFLVGYLIYMFQVYFIARKKYSFIIEKELVQLLVTKVAIAVGCFLAMKLIKDPYQYFIGGAIVLFSVYYSYNQLDKRININEIIALAKQKIFPKK